MPNFANVNLITYPDPINVLADNQALVIGDLHGNALKLIWTLVESGVMEIDEESYTQLVTIYQTPPEQLTSEHIHTFNSIITAADINPRHLNLIGDELCDRGQNDYFTLVVLNKLKQENMPVEIMLSNHSIEFLKNYQNRTLSNVESDLAGSDTSIRGLNTLITNNIVSAQEISYLVENAYKPNLRLLSHSHDNDGNQTLYTHAPSALETVRTLARKFNINYDGSQQSFAACVDAINQYFHDNFDAEVGAIIDTMEAVQTGERPLILGMSPVSTDYPLVRLIWHRVTSQEDINELDLPEWLKAVHGHEGDVRRSLEQINNRNDQNPDFEAINIENDNPAQSYHERMTNLDNDLGKRELTGSYHYHTTTETSAVLAIEPPDDLVSITPTELQRFTAQLMGNLKHGNNLLLDEQQGIWDRINGEINYTEQLRASLTNLALDEHQAQLIFAAIGDKEGSLPDLISGVLGDRFDIDGLPDDYAMPLTLQMSNNLNTAIADIEGEDNKRQAVFKANQTFNKLRDTINLVDSHLINDQKELIVGLISPAIINDMSVSLIKSNLELIDQLLGSDNENERRFVNYLINHCIELQQLSVASDFQRLGDDEKQAVIAELNYRQESDEIDIHANFSTHVRQIVNRFKDKNSNNNRSETISNYLAAHPISYDYAKVEAHTRISSGLENESHKVIAMQLANKVHEYCHNNDVNTLHLSSLEECYSHIKTLLQGDKDSLKNLETEIDDDLVLTDKLKCIINQNITAMFNQHAIAKDSLNELARRIFRVGEAEVTTNPYGLSFFSRTQCHYRYSEVQDNGEVNTQKVSVKLSKTMQQMMDWIEKARQGKISTEHAQYQIAKLGKKALQKHGIADGDETAKGQLYLFASTLQTNNNGWQLTEAMCQDYCLKMYEKINNTRWDIRAPAGKVVDNNRLSSTMQHMIADIRKAQRGQAAWSQVYNNIKMNAARATCRHANSGKIHSRRRGKTAPYELYSEIATSNILTFSHREAAIVLEAIKRDMDAIIENPAIQKKVMGCVIGGTATILDKFSSDLGSYNPKRKIPKNMAKMYAIYERYKLKENNPECTLQSLKEIMQVAQKASINDHWLRRSELQRFYKKVAKDGYAVSEHLVTPRQ